MATRKKAATKAGSGPTKPAGGAEALIDALAPPQAALVRAFRELLLALGPRVQQDVKWKSPSFRTGDHFATLHLRDPRKAATLLPGVASISSSTKEIVSAGIPRLSFGMPISSSVAVSPGNSRGMTRVGPAMVAFSG